MAEQRSIPDYDNPNTGSDPSKWSEKTVADLPQRGRQPRYDLKCEDSDFYNTGSKDWKDPIGAQYCQVDYDDKGAIDNNYPVKQRRDWDFYGHGWRTEPSEALPGGESGSSNKASNTPSSVEKPRAGSPTK